MNKENILYGIIGILLGAIIGYVATNSINQERRPLAQAQRGPEMNPQTGPVNQPAAGGDAGSAAGPQAEVMEAIAKARQEPGNFRAQLNAAKLFYQIQSFDRGNEFIGRATQNAAKATPQDFETLRELGDAVFFANRYAEAEKWYALALRLKPADPDLNSDLGACYFNLQPRQLDKAIAAWRVALKSDPKQEVALQNLTAALAEKGDKAGAGEMLKQLEKLNPDNQTLPQLRSRINTP